MYNEITKSTYHFYHCCINNLCVVFHLEIHFIYVEIFKILSEQISPVCVLAKSENSLLKCFNNDVKVFQNTTCLNSFWYDIIFELLRKCYDFESIDARRQISESRQKCFKIYDSNILLQCFRISIKWYRFNVKGTFVQNIIQPCFYDVVKMF